MVSVGLTVVLPPAGSTSPIPEISTFVAFRTSQMSVAGWPSVMVSGSAEKRRMVIWRSSVLTVTRSVPTPFWSSLTVNRK